MTLRVEKDTPTVYTGSLLNQEIHPVPRKPLGNPLSNQTRLQHTIHHEPFKKHTHFGKSHTNNIDLDHIKSTQHSLATQHQKYRRLRRDYTCLQNNLKQYKCNLISLS